MTALKASTVRALPPLTSGRPTPSSVKAITCAISADMGDSGPRPVCNTQGASTALTRSDLKCVSSQARALCMAGLKKPSVSCAPCFHTRPSIILPICELHSSLPSRAKISSAFCSTKPMPAR